MPTPSATPRSRSRSSSRPGCSPRRRCLATAARSTASPGTRWARSPPPRSAGCSAKRMRCASSASAAPRWPARPPRCSTGMSAVIGGDEDALLARLDRARPAARELQRRRSGRRRRRTRRPRRPRGRPDPRQPRHPAAGRRRLPHAVHGARRRTARPQRPPSSRPTTRDIRLWTNRDGVEISDGKHFVDLMVGQVSSPVRWDKVMASLEAAGRHRHHRARPGRRPRRAREARAQGRPCGRRSRRQTISPPRSSSMEAAA